MNTTYWRNKIMNDMYRSGDNEFWIGLSSTEPTVGGGNVTEPIGNGYSRVQITSFTQAEMGIIKNTDDIVFPTSEGTWFPADHLATHWVLFDGDDDSANVLSSGTLEVPIGIWANTIVRIGEERVIITLIDET